MLIDVSTLKNSILRPYLDKPSTLKQSLKASREKQPTFRNAILGFPQSRQDVCETSAEILMIRHYPDLGSASDWLKQIFSQSDADLGRVTSSV